MNKYGNYSNKKYKIKNKNTSNRKKIITILILIYVLIFFNYINVFKYEKDVEIRYAENTVKYIEINEDNLKNLNKDERKIEEQRNKNIKNKLEINKKEFSSKEVFYYDIEKNELINIKGNKEDKIVPASVLKLFTIEYILNKLKLDQVVTVGNEISLVSSDESQAGIKKGEKYTVKELLEMMFLPSGNDATYTLSKWYLKNYENVKVDNISNNEMVKEFSDKINKYLKEKNINNTNITNPSGISKDSYISKEDIVKVVKNLIKKEDVMAIPKEHKIEINKNNRKIELINTNKFLDKSSKFYDENIIGLKTGSLSVGKNISVLYENPTNKKKYVIFVFGAKTDDDRYKDSIKVREIIENEIFSSKSK